MPKAHPGLSVVVPVFNSAGSLLELHRRLVASLRAIGRPYEIVLVNDGSHDESWGVIEELSRIDSSVRGLDLFVNSGQHNALLAGIREARHELIVTIDDDLQYPPEEISKLIAKLEREELDIVYGVAEEISASGFRRFASRTYRWFLRTFGGLRFAAILSPFRLFRSDLTQVFGRYESDFVSIDALLSWSTQRIGHLEVLHGPRLLGQSNYTLGRLLRHAFDIAIAFSVRPLRVASLAGLVSVLFGMTILGFVLFRYFFGTHPVPGFTFTASVVLIFSGAQMVCLGVIGEYIGKLHLRSMGKPFAVVRRCVP